jgi:hypothetical protein
MDLNEDLRTAADLPNRNAHKPAGATWAQRLGRLIAPITKRNREDGAYAHANRDSVRRAILGRDPFGTWTHPTSGARMVVNLSSAHIPAFCNAVKRNDLRPYKNCYDLARLGGRRVSKDRRLVDQALPVSDMTKVYFGAVELNGAGIRLYGDMCLVLKNDATDDATCVLDRNSFELLRSPVADEFAGRSPADAVTARQRKLQFWSGLWTKDLGFIAAMKVLRSVGARDRRWTVGQISQAVREDEDYIEVLRMESFGPADLQEARLSSADAAHDALVGNRLLRGPIPRLESLIWRSRRIRAERALRVAGVVVRIVTAAGRTRD